MSLLTKRTRQNENPAAAEAIEKAGQSDLVRINIEVTKTMRDAIKMKAISESKTVRELITETLNKIIS